jgi:Ca2+/Na+ antiporter
MDVTNLVIGVLIVVVTVSYLIYTFRKAAKDKDYDHMTYSFDVNIVVGTVIILLVGIILIYRELSKLQIALMILILLPFLGFSQSMGCDDLKHGVFEIYENNEKVGLVYRKGNFQIEDYLNGKELTTVQINEKDCLFYINSLKTENSLDTITMFVSYERIKKGYYTFLAKPGYLDLDYEYRGEIKKIGNEIESNILDIFEQLENDGKNVPK